jgi:tetratricopeptide (TPR) repeat protein
MPLKLIITGRPLSAAAISALNTTRDGFAASRTLDSAGGVLPSTLHLFDTLQVLGGFDISSTIRAAKDGADQRHELPLEDDDIIEWELESGFKLWTSVAAYRDDLTRFRPELVSGNVVTWAAPRRLGAEQRGLSEWKDHFVRFWRLAPDAITKQALEIQQWPEELFDREFVKKSIAKLGAWATTKALVWLLERQLTPGPGLYRWPEGAGGLGARFEKATLVRATEIPRDQSILVCLHGTASSTVGSFGYLNAVDPKSGGPPQREWQRLCDHFGRHIYAWEHRTLGESPIDNALALAKVLPHKAHLNLLSHSRGGLIGDLLCLPSIPQRWRDVYSHGPGLADADAFDKAQLERLDRELTEKQFIIERFVRVACPARGTLLASENIERFLSLLLHLIGLIPGFATSGLYNVVKRIILEVARNRTNAKWIPGIAAMVPDSPLIRLLNAARATSSTQGSQQQVSAGGQLGVIAGDWKRQGASLAQSLLVPISDLFIFGWTDNDWVVDTDSMFLGAPRNKQAYYVFDQGGDVSHFKYFENARTRTATADWLVMPLAADRNQPGGSGSKVPGSFQKIAESSRRESLKRGISADDKSDDSKRKPLLFFFPDLFGSKLQAPLQEGKFKTIWLDFDSLSHGGLKQLHLFADKAKNAQTAEREESEESKESNACDAADPCDCYVEWLTQLNQQYHLINCAYDWRCSVEDSARKLLPIVQKWLEERPGTYQGVDRARIRFVAHGAGGLVLQRLLTPGLSGAAQSGVDEQLASHPNLRILLLGTPLRGMAAVAAMLTGFDSPLRRLAMLDPEYPLARVLELFATFPGLLELLPDEERWFQRKTWEEFANANRGVGALPAQKALTRAEQAIRERQDRVESAFKSAKWSVRHVLGRASGTLCDVRVERGELAVEVTDRGDGRVTYASSVGVEDGASGKQDEAPYFADADHGQLASHAELIPAYIELLEQGATSRLSRTRLPSADQPPPRRLQLLPKPVLFPTEQELVDDLFGSGGDRPSHVKTRQVAIRVFHGDLRYAKYPVMVGHYEGDTISGVERYLDKKLRGVLVDRYRMGSYPGSLHDSLTVVPHTDKHVKQFNLPAGALVVGLGRMGELSSGTLTQAVRSGLIDYALEMSSRDDFDDDRQQPASRSELGVSLLIIGAQTAATMTIEDCVTSLLRGVALANQELEGSRSRPRINAVEIVELFIDSAVAALNAAAQAGPTLLREFGTEFVFENNPPRLSQHRSGRLRIDPLPTSHTWRRWEVTALPVPTVQETVRQLPEPLRELLSTSLQAERTSDLAARQALSTMLRLDANMDGNQANTPLGLRFVAMSDRARAEKKIEGRQRPVINDLIRRSIGDGIFQSDIARALGELLIPNDLKDSLAQLDRLVMVLDRDTASIPWELLVLNEVPLATRIGLVRQLSTADYRLGNRRSLPRSAFVVGNPVTQDGIPSLDGAQNEARDVAELLADHGFCVTDCYTARAEAHEVFVGLLQRPYRVLHLAGHGYFSSNKEMKPTRFGMLLSNNQYLTAQEIQQLTHIPDLVFLNCCHLAGMDGETKRERQFEYSKLAASLAEELINMGVRAIVAAGWAVRDDLAKQFAAKFYQRMLAGAPFGEAVREARVAVWQSAPDSNTWAAYQAYGDPDYRLRSRPPGGAASVAKGSDLRMSAVSTSESGGPHRALPRDSKLSVIPQQLVEKLRQVAIAGQLDDEDALRQLGVAVDSPDDTLDELIAGCPSDWLDRVDVLSAMGRAYAELGRYRLAMDVYQRALESSPTEESLDGEGQLTLQAIEQLADCGIRLGRIDRNKELIDASIKRLDLLIQLRENAARLALLGTAYKCRAVLEQGAQTRRSLALAREKFQKAAELEDKLPSSAGDVRSRRSQFRVQCRCEAAVIQFLLAGAPSLDEAPVGIEASSLQKFLSSLGDLSKSRQEVSELALAATRDTIEVLPIFDQQLYRDLHESVAAKQVLQTMILMPNMSGKSKKVSQGRKRRADQQVAKGAKGAADAETVTSFVDKFSAKYHEEWRHRRATRRMIAAWIDQIKITAELIAQLNPHDLRAGGLHLLVKKLAMSSGGGVESAS